jgi:cobyrinic acid a,c-diamide synthase
MRDPVRGALLVAGTSSDAGKSVLVAGLCRWLARQGVRVAPFKAQNMSLNSAVTADGAEIGRDQAMQAAAAGIQAEAAMNPVLLKPGSETRSQVVLLGQPAGEAGALDYQDLKPALEAAVAGSLADLRSRFDVVICEGAGSPAEVNLRHRDIANMGLARPGPRRQPQLTVPSRHLGLIPAPELGGEAASAVDALSEVIAASVDLPAVLRLARTASPLPGIQSPHAERDAPPRPLPRPRIAVATGKAFTFGYAEHPELLTAAGAEVVAFDPLRDERLPDAADGLVIGGGFPEEHAAQLSANERLRHEVAALARAGAPVIAECAGLLYLARSLDGQPMCGVLGVDAGMTGKLTLGYRDAVAAYLHTHWSGIPGAAGRITAAARRQRESRAHA